MQSIEFIDVHNEDQLVDFFEQTGFLGPFDLISQSNLNSLQRADEKGIRQPKGKLQRKLAKLLRKPDYSNVIVERLGHIKSKLVYDLATEPQILDHVAHLLGPDILLWIAEVKYREPGNAGQTWHIDKVNALVKGVHVSVAITDMKVHNGCLQVIPGTHHYDIDLDSMATMGECNLSDAQSLVNLADRLYPEKAPHKIVSMEMKSGQYFFTRGGLWHGVGPNTDQQTRIALVARFARPDIEVRNLANEPVPCILVRGRDAYNLNSIHPTPPN